MNVVIDDKLEERFRKTIADTKGLRKGNISDSLEEAISLWIEAQHTKNKLSK
jgi:regulator of replication initiation timing